MDNTRYWFVLKEFATSFPGSLTKGGKMRDPGNEVEEFVLCRIKLVFTAYFGQVFLRCVVDTTYNGLLIYQ